jgi:hypothetical protein
MSTDTAAKRSKRIVESVAGRDSYLAFGRRMIRAFGRRAGEGDLDALEGLLVLQDELAQTIRAAGAAAHDHGYSWTEIGAACGTTRQAAERRFGTITERTSK